MTTEDISDIPETGAIFTFGKSRFADNAPSHFFVRKDPIIDLSCGDEHTVVVCKRGRVFSFGRNAWGELGLGNRSAAARPNCIKSLKPYKVIHVASGRAHTLFLTDAGQVFSCGNNDDGQLGLGNNMDSDSPQDVNIDENVKQLAAGFKHSAALTDNGKVFVWGGNAEGQLGLGEDVGTVNIPTRLPLDATIVQLSCGYYHTLLLSDDGKVFAFGEGEHGKLGLENCSNSSYPKCINSDPSNSFIAAGGNHSCFLTRKGELYVWGSNEYGQIGLKDTTSVAVPTLMPFEHTIIYVALGENHSAIITDNNELFTFGDNHHGKLAIDKVQDIPQVNKLYIPTKIKKFENFDVMKVNCGGCHSMVLAKPRIINGKSSSIKNQLWEIYEGSSSCSSNKETLPPLSRVTLNTSSSSALSPPSDSPTNTVLFNKLKVPSSPSFSVGNNLAPNHYLSDETDDNSKETNGDSNGNSFENENSQTPKIVKSASCEYISRKSVSYLVQTSKSCELIRKRGKHSKRKKKKNFYSWSGCYSKDSLDSKLSKLKRSSKLGHCHKHCKSSSSNKKSQPCAEPFEIWYKKHKEDMNYLTGQIYNAGRNLRQVIKKVESYFNCAEYSIQNLTSLNDELSSDNSDVCVNYESRWIEPKRSICSLNTSQNCSLNKKPCELERNSNIDIDLIDFGNSKDEKASHFQPQLCDQLLWLKGCELVDKMKKELILTDDKAGGGDGPEVHLISELFHSMENETGDAKDIIESIAGEGKNGDSKSVPDGKMSRLLTKIKKSPSQHKSTFLANDFKQVLGNEDQSSPNRKSKMCILL